MKMENHKSRRYPGGRKTAKDPASHYITFRLTTKEKNSFDELFLKTGLSDRTKFLKSVIFNKKIKVIKIDRATMDYYVQLTHFYSQFRKIGNNYNQVVLDLKRNFGEKRALALLYKLEKVTIHLVMVCQEVVRLTEEYEEKWLQKDYTEEEHKASL